MKLLTFAFAGTIAETVATLLDSDNTIILLPTEAAVHTFVDTTDFAAYDFVLGLGMYSGQDHDKLRIETECSSRFRNRGSSDTRIAVPYFLQPTDTLKLANGIGNSWCNLVSYQILTTSHGVPYTFIHIPKDFDPKAAGDTINRQLADLTS